MAKPDKARLDEDTLEPQTGDGQGQPAVDALQELPDGERVVDLLASQQKSKGDRA
jgi:hypothetical protein